MAVNALWPSTTIDTEAISLIAGQEARKIARSPASWPTPPNRPHATEPQRHRKISINDEVLTQRRRDRPLPLSPPRGREADLMPDFFL